MIVFLLITASIFLTTGAQLLLKAGVNKIGYFDFCWSNMISIGCKMAMNWPIIGGVSLYIISMLVWLMVLSRVEVGFAYPMLSVGYILNAIAAYYLFGESLTWMRLSGILVIMIGVYLVSQS